MLSFQLLTKGPESLITTDLSIPIQVDQKEQLTVGELKRRIIDEIKKKKNCKIMGGNLDIDNISIMYTDKKGEIGVIGKEVQSITQRELKQYSELTIQFRGAVKVMQVETDEEIDERIKAEDERSKRELEISTKGIASQLDSMADQFLAANSRLNDSLINLVNISSDIADDIERKITEDDKKLQLIGIWNINLINIISSLPPDNMNWEFFEILLKRFSAANPHKKIEVVLCTDKKPDVDIANVLELMCTSGAKKDKSYLILPVSLVDRLSRSIGNDIICNTKIDTLNFLRHWSTEFDTKTLSDEVNKATSIIKKTPNINMVVLRGCSTAGKIEDAKLFDSKNIRIVGAKKDIETEPVKTNEFLFQQYNQGNGEKTRIKYHDQIKDKFIVKELEDIPHNTSGNKLSVEVEKALAASSDKYDLPLLSFQSKEMSKLINKIREDWLQNKPTSQEDKKIMKATEKRTKTYVVSQFPLHASLARALEDQLAKEGIIVSIKSYGGPYKGYRSGPMITADHGHHVLPKALKKLK